MFAFKIKIVTHPCRHIITYSKLLIQAKTFEHFRTLHLFATYPAISLWDPWHTRSHLCLALARHLVACGAAGCGLPSRHQRGALLASRLSASPAVPRMVPAPGCWKSVWSSFDSFSFTCCSASKSFLDNLLLTNRFKLASVHASFHCCCLSQLCSHDAETLCSHVVLKYLRADSYREKKNHRKENSSSACGLK